MAEQPRKNKDFMTRWLIAFARNDAFYGPTNKEMGINSSTIKVWRDNDAEFDEAVKEIFQNSLDILEKEAYKRAHEGEEEDIYYQGNVVGVRRNKSDALLMWYINNKRGYANKSEHRVAGITGEPPVGARLDFYPENLTRAEQDTLAALLEKAQTKPEKPVIPSPETKAPEPAPTEE